MDVDEYLDLVMWISHRQACPLFQAKPDLDNVFSHCKRNKINCAMGIVDIVDRNWLNNRTTERIIDRIDERMESIKETIIESMGGQMHS